MEQTEKLGLWLPGKNDPLEISKLNENSQRLDEFAQESGGGAHKVGDILTTWRTDLGEDWLLCNGEAFSQEEYPALAAITPGMLAMTELCQSEALPVSSGAVGYASDGAQEVILTSGGNLLVSSDGFITVTTHDAPSSGEYRRIFYVNGQWVFAVNTATSISAFYLADDPAGPWTKVALSNTEICVEHLEYFNGRYWVFGPGGSSGDRKPEYGSFSDFGISSILVNEIAGRSGASFVRTDKFVFVCAGSGGSSYVYSNIYLVSTDDPSGEWETSGPIALPPSPVSGTKIMRIGANFAEQGEKFLGAVYLRKFHSTAGGGTAYDDYTHVVGLVIEDGEARFLPPVALPGGISNVSLNVLHDAPLIVRGAYLFGGYSDSVFAADDAGNLTVAPIAGFGPQYTQAVVTRGRALFFAKKLAGVPVYGVPAIAPPQSHAYIKAK